MKNQFESVASNGGHLPVEFLRKRKMLLFLPVLVLPLLTFAFWKLGGGSGGPKQTGTPPQGINTDLPGADLKNQKPEGKLDIYERRKQETVTDAVDAFSALRFDTARHTGLTTGSSPNPGASAAEANETAIRQRLAQINQEIGRPSPPLASPVHQAQVYPDNNNLDRMEKLVRGRAGQQQQDPEMQQLNAMLEKIIDIQHPERRDTSLGMQVKPRLDSLYKAFRAVIAENQKVTGGSTVKLRLIDTLITSRQIIPKGQLLYGVCQLTNQRLILNIGTIRLGTSILPVNLSVYDLDAMPGINAPEAIVTDAIRGGTGNALQSIGLMGIDQTVTAQLAGASLEAAKGLLGKKIKPVKVRLKAGYLVLLRDNEARR